MIGHPLVQLLGELELGIEPGRGFSDAGALHLERFDLVRQGQGLQEEKLDGEQLGLAGSPSRFWRRLVIMGALASPTPRSRRSRSSPAASTVQVRVLASSAEALP
ncbi:hypothetical protein AHiyo8_21060 [Arthrobacter sp. Hiyo8]|nr:hypothetical protein AHiyo8_21060 [Arthrobacter sp. Hiyo8]